MTYLPLKMTRCRGHCDERRHLTRVAATPFVIVFLAVICLSGCTCRFDNWSGNSVVFGNVKVVSVDGDDLTKFCTGAMLVTNDYVPGEPYSLTYMNRDRPNVYIYQFDNDGAYFAATAPDKPTLISLNCRKVLSSSFSREIVNDIHISIGEFTSPKQDAASYFGHLTVRLESDGGVRISLNEGDKSRTERTPLSVTKQRLPMFKIPLASIGEPIGWTGTTHPVGHILFP